MNTLRLLTLSLVAISISLSDANSMKRPRSESKENQPIQGKSDNKRPKFVKGRVPVVLKEINTLSKPKVDGLFKIICRDGLVISDIPLSVLQESGIMLQMAQSAKSDTIALKQYSKDLLTNVIIPCMNFLSSKSITSSSPSMKRGSLLNSLNKDARIKELSRRLFQSCFKGRQKANLKINQALVLNILSTAHNLEIPELIQATLLIIEQNLDLFFTRTKRAPYGYLIQHSIQDPIRQYLDEIFSRKYNAESLTVIPEDIVCSEIVPHMIAPALCNFACTNKMVNKMCTNLTLNQSCGIERIFSLNIHSISMIEKFITFLESKSVDGVDFETPMQLAYRSFSAGEAVLKTLLILWVNKASTEDLLERFLGITEVQLVITDLITNTDGPIELDITIHKEQDICIDIRDILATIMLWAAQKNGIHSIKTFAHSIRRNVFKNIYQQQLYQRICFDDGFIQTLVKPTIEFAINNHMPYFLNHLLDSEHEKIEPFINGDLARKLLKYVQSDWGRFNETIQTAIKQTLLRYYHDSYEIRTDGRIVLLA